MGILNHLIICSSTLQKSNSESTLTNLQHLEIWFFDCQFHAEKHVLKCVLLGVENQYFKIVFSFFEHYQELIVSNQEYYLNT